MEVPYADLVEDPLVGHLVDGLMDAVLDIDEEYTDV